jgi:small subunit ribosomal protein S16
VPVRIRMKKMGKKARPFYRIVVVDARSPRDGKVIEELGHYDPMVPDTDARVELKRERVDYWLGVGAQPTEKTAVLIKKYGTSGTHLAKQEAAVTKLQASRNRRQSLAVRSQEASSSAVTSE